ncbi:hypothetical protein GCM10010193_14670 [Kitasatospora atroaurantiaca]|uniref:Uncharacterized protein n=1 Tax=Kitasatospora atroaurantiaca TaxID=285545 RepID=A0A561EIB2_9ACTN|nr:hypothetical protein [Kitasatospora atroaurantiaca]TWE15355.1 hypothetical protein FB465_0248 [Kitasatospora atroaurantiaca]
MAVLAIGMVTGISGTAHAGGYGCNGNLVYSQDYYGEGAYTNTVVAHVYGYWDGANNCEVAVKKVFVGQSTRTSLQVWSNTDPNSPKDDTGYFSWYAGPVSVHGIGSCIWDEVAMWDASGNEIAQAHSGAHNCS